MLMLDDGLDLVSNANVPRYTAIQGHHLALSPHRMPSLISGPLPLSRGCAHLLTCVDCFTHWPKAVPIADITSNSEHSFLKADSVAARVKATVYQLW